MKGKVYFCSLTDFQAAMVNRKGWSGVDFGKAYLDATINSDIGKAVEFGLYEPAAEVEAEDPEQVYFSMQNVDQAWIDKAGLTAVQKVLTKRPRSMSVGDYIEWENGTKEVVTTLGFEEV
jgi:hypothetical protein